MIIDSSAIIAIIFRERDYERLLEKLTDVNNVGISTATLVETGIIVSARLGRDARPTLYRFLDEAGIVEVPFGAEHWREAVGAYLQFGKGRHPARLNFGDCIAYATSKLAGSPLLCVGDDFPRTDLELA